MPSLQALLRDRRLQRLVGVSSLLSSSQACITGGFGAVLLTGIAHVATETVGIAFAVMQAVSMALRIGMGHWSDRRGERLRPMFQIALTLTALSLIVTFLLRSGGVVLVPVIVIVGAMSMAWNGLSFTATAELAGRAASGTALGIQQTALGAWAFLATPSFGALVSASSWLVGFLALAIVTAASAWLLHPLLEPSEVRRRDAAGPRQFIALCVITYIAPLDRRGGAAVNKASWKAIDEARGGQPELGNHVIDELMLGNVSRRDFIRRGAVVGLGASTMGAILAACGGANSASSAGGSSGTTAVKAGGTLRVAMAAPNTAPNPLLVSDVGGVAMITQTGEYLVLDNPFSGLQPMLATSWRPNANGDVWTFKLRPNVRFSNGKLMTARDVVYTFDVHTNPKNASAALSALQGNLSQGHTEAVDDHTVVFHLDGPIGNFPYLVSSDTYNVIILPEGTDPKEWGKTFVGTGPFKLVSFTTNQGMKFERNPEYWGAKALVDRTDFTFYDSPQPQILALQSGTVDVIQQVAVQGSSAILNNPQYTIVDFHSSAYREVHMRCDIAPFTDNRVRQALALTLNRPQIASALFHERSTLGNDSPFAHVFKSTNTSVPQRAQDLTKAKALLQAGGMDKGFSVTLTTETLAEIPQYAQIIQQSAKQVGININLKIEPEASYYGKATFGQSDWLDSQLGITDYGARGVPNVFLQATLMTNGIWNAARFNNASYNKLVKQYVAAVDLQSQRKLSGQIENLLLDETPVIIAYFFDWLTPVKKGVTGVVPGPEGQMFLGRASVA